MQPLTSLHFPERRESLTVASDYYTHPYGGIARDIYVTREGFARFFEHSVEFIDDMPYNIKLFDDFHPGLIETYGYICEAFNGNITYRITILDQSFQGRVKFHNQECRRLAKAFELTGEAFKTAARHLNEIRN